MLQPLDIKSKSFKKGLFGYKASDVDSFKEALYKEYEELYNLAPIVKNLRRDADQVNAFFINYPESIDE